LIIDMNLFTAILPDNERNIKLLFLMFFLGLIPGLVMAFAQASGIKILFSIFFILCLIMLRIKIPQLILLLTLVPMIFTFVSQDLANLVISAVVLFGLIWIGAKVALGRACFEHSTILEIIMAIYFFFALNIIISVLYNSTLNMYSISESVRYASYACMLFVLYYFMNKMKIITNLVLTALVVSVAIAVYSCYLAFDIGAKNLLQFAGVAMHGIRIGFTNANTIATVIANSIPIVMAYCMFGVERKWKLLSLVLLIFLILVWLPLNSRSSYLFIFGAVLTLVLFHNRRRLYLSIIIGVILGGYILVISDIFPLLKIFLRLEKGLTYRGDLWTAAIRMFAESPILGKGPEYFDRFKFYYMDPGFGRYTSGYNFGLSPHNVLLMRAVDMGIFAIVAQIFLWIIPIVIFVKDAKIVRHSRFYFLYLASGATLVGMVLRSITEVGNNVFSIIALVMLLRIPLLINNAD